MQGADALGGGQLPGVADEVRPSGTCVDQLPGWRRQQRAIQQRRALGIWWPRLLLVVLGGGFATGVGIALAVLPAPFVRQNGLAIGAALLAGPVLLVLFAFAARQLAFGLLLLAVLAAPLVPTAFSVRSVDVYSADVLLALLVVVIVVRTALHARRFVWPSFALTWPLLGLVTVALISDLMIQVTWIPGVSHDVNGTPAVYSDLLGIVMYATPLLVLIASTACLTGRGHWIERILTALLIVAVLAAVLVYVDFKRTGADVFTYRFQEPHVLYMKLGDLAQAISLGVVIAYARALHARRKTSRFFCVGLCLFLLLGLVFTLQVARWVAVAVALVLMTVVFSRRLALLLTLASVAASPLFLLVLGKLEQVKARDATRFGVWADFLRVWSKRPVLGVGPGNAWTYDQAFTRLPMSLRNFGATGLGVAHDGTLQLLAEVGPAGVFLFYVFIGATVIAAARLYRRSRSPRQRADRILGLVCLSWIIGSLAGDYFSGVGFLPPAQIGGFDVLPSVLGTWIVIGCLAYRDQRWRMARRRFGSGAELPASAGGAPHLEEEFL